MTGTIGLETFQDTRDEAPTEGSTTALGPRLDDLCRCTPNGAGTDGGRRHGVR